MAVAALEGGRRLEDQEQQEEVITVHGCDIESPDISECNEKINLKGPFSPLEMKVYGITNSSLGKNVKIEYSSVNTVLLDAEPQDPHTRYVVKNAKEAFKFKFRVLELFCDRKLHVNLKQKYNFC